MSPHIVTSCYILQIHSGWIDYLLSHIAVVTVISFYIPGPMLNLLCFLSYCSCSLNFCVYLSCYVPTWPHVLISFIPRLTWYWFNHYSLYSLVVWKCVQFTNSSRDMCSVPTNFMESKNVKLFPAEVQCLPNFGKLDLSCMETCSLLPSLTY